MEEVMMSAVDALSASVPLPEKEYMGEDGFLHCAKCNDRVQTDVEVFGTTRRVRCICRCRIAEKERIADRERQEESNRKRMVCFAESNMIDWTFENDDRKNPRISDAMIRYTENFPQFLKEGKGLLLHGPVGTGKTYSAACIANRLIDKGYSAFMTNFARLTNKIQGMYDGKQEYIDSLNRYSLLVVDDLGTERKSEFMQEMVFNIIDSRYRAGLPFIVTTNLTTDEIKKPQDVGYSRIYDRILERCFPVEVAGQSRRRASVKETYNATKDILGL
jgi:DNA replication protein DnaC